VSGLRAPEQVVHLHVPESELAVERLGHLTCLEPGEVGSVVEPRTGCSRRDRAAVATASVLRGVPTLKIATSSSVWKPIAVVTASSSTRPR
jgi:hypothetical protein